MLMLLVIIVVVGVVVVVVVVVVAVAAVVVVVEVPLRNEFSAFWEFLRILKNSQLCKLAVNEKAWNSWEFLRMEFQVLLRLRIPRNS